MLLSTFLCLVACDNFFGEGDNSPTIFDTPEEQAARAERRAVSPATHIYGKRFDFLYAVIDGKKFVPPSGASLILEELLARGFDGCTKFTVDGGGVFTPSGYEYSLLDNETISYPNQVECGPGEERFSAVNELKGRVWSLVYEDGQLQMKDYNGEAYEFMLQIRKESN